MAQIHIVVNMRPLDTDRGRTDTWTVGEPLHLKPGTYDGPVGAHTRTVQALINVTGVPDEIPFERLKRIFELPHETEAGAVVTTHALRRLVLDVAALSTAELDDLRDSGRVTVTWARCLALFDLRTPGLRTRFRKMRRADFDIEPPGRPRG